ncbi:MAG: RNA methyltransferase [Burkholderiaceae bacterium]|nr:RNA methyltransferase [Burkholderiaceae bacterium]
MKSIASEANPRYRAWLRLAESPRQIRLAGRTLAEGIHVIEAARAAAHPIEALLVRRGAQGQAVERLAAQLAHEGVACYELSPALFDRLSPVERGAGLIAVIAVTHAPEPRDLAADALYLDGVQDPGNVGALLRVAAAAGVRHVLAGPGTAALWAPKVVRAAQGAHFALALYDVADPAHLKQALRGPWFGADAHAATSLWEVALPSAPIGWIFGAEGRGLSAAARAVCDAYVTIPMASAVESLNVESAAAVCLFERRRRLLSANGERVRPLGEGGAFGKNAPSQSDGGDDVG